ncbi:MAG TPA: pyridoxamine kinase [Oscillospiraceae bacterium]|nr:pyridoxamine kinase [Oscillospiraceae bacterium]HPS34062.1 pyridoxamine kinase [Oscillospiraceae bacterium]
MAQKRAVTIQDISCFGKCSLTVALPIISAAGVEIAAIPTAVLSTHTGGFTGYTYRDLTDDITPIAAHWKSLGLKFDAIYTGYLGSFEQLRLMGEFFDSFKGSGIVMIDPVMADNGILYGGFSPDFPAGMAKLCVKADLIVPNLTEAAFMLGEKFVGDTYDRAYIETLLKKLSGLGPKQVVLTGISFAPDKLGAACYDTDTGKVDYYFNERVPGYFHGTGDVFASALLSAVLRGKTLPEAIKIATEFTLESIKRTAAAKTEPRNGVDFEESLPNFIKALNA